MAFASIALGALALVFMVLGFMTTGVPAAGAIFSFGGPVLALGGIVTGGLAMSRSKAETGETSGAALGGLVLSIVSFVLSLLVALTCGLCNACLTTASIEAGNAANGVAQTQGAQNVGQAIGDMFDEVGRRIEVMAVVSSIRQSCMADPSGASLSTSIHPAVLPGLQGTVCTEVTDATVTAFSQDCQSGTPCSAMVPLDSAPEAASVRAAGITDLSTCRLFVASSARVVVCQTPAGSQLVVGTNLAHVQ